MTDFDEASLRWHMATTNPEYWTEEMKTKAKDDLFELAQKMYRSESRRITPIYPWILVRVLPKEQQLGSLWMPESQNKVLYEGIVLETWRPFYRDLYTRRTVISEGMFQKGAECEENSRVWVKSELQLGDHVLFPHFEGMPVPYLDAKDYRFVRELARPGSKDDEKCVIMGKLESQEPIEEQIRERYNAPVSWDLFINGLLRDYYVVPKTAAPRTTSGYNGPR